MKVITAIENKEINEQLNKIEKINILNSDIQYKEGILEYLEKNKNVEIILIKEDLPGQITLEKLISKINKINNKIKIIIINNNLKEIENIFEENKTVQYIFLNNINKKSILKILNIEFENNILIKKEKAKIIEVLGNRGSGKTLFASIIILLIIKFKNNKILFLDENEEKILTKTYLKNKYKNNNYLIKGKLNNYEKIKVRENLYLLNINYLINNKINILEYLNKIKNEFNYIIIDSNNKNINKYNNLINEKIFLLEGNIIEIEKAKKYLIKNKMKIILNKTNINDIDEEIIEKILNKKIIGKIKYSKNINLFINNNFDLKYLDKKEINNFLKIIEKI